MIKEIPIGQKCESFNPVMMYPEKTQDMVDDPRKNNTSCFAPAYVYLEGTRGKRFLCDYCYFFEKRITVQRTPELWPGISQIFINNLEDVKKSFPKDDGLQEISDDTLCYCKRTAYVAAKYKKNGFVEHLCNFHFRKKHYRYINHHLRFEDFVDIRDERHRMKMSIEEEFNNLPLD